MFSLKVVLFVLGLACIARILYISNSGYITNDYKKAKEVLEELFGITSVCLIITTVLFFWIKEKNMAACLFLLLGVTSFPSIYNSNRKYIKREEKLKRALEKASYEKDKVKRLIDLKIKAIDEVQKALFELKYINRDTIAKTLLDATNLIAKCNTTSELLDNLTYFLSSRVSILIEKNKRLEYEHLNSQSQKKKNNNNDKYTYTVEEALRLLGLDKTATIEDIKRSYRKLAMKHHPDRGGHVNTFHKLNNAYEKLKGHYAF